MIYPLVRRLLFHFDPEDAHEFAVEQLSRLQQIPPLLALVRRSHRRPTGAARELWGLRFPTPVGLAAGFDKSAAVIPFLAALGFGFIEVGTVTLRPQAGNPRPRLFRYPADRALVNRLGFNNDGAEAVAARLQAWNALGESGNAVERPPVFVNIGKDRDVELEEATGAYRGCYAILAPWADGVVVNVSSPNTPGLRDLQRPEHLRSILLALREMRALLRFARRGTHPILVKIAPDLDQEQLREICGVCLQLADGIVATNTTIDRSVLPAATSQAGGLSGRPLFQRSTQVLALVRKAVGPEYPLIGVGGVFSAGDAQAKLDAGANLVQIYTGFIYEGPGLPSRLARDLIADRGLSQSAIINHQSSMLQR
jgi:dihydroorotate dehydrogenase